MARGGETKGWQEVEKEQEGKPVWQVFVAELSPSYEADGRKRDTGREGEQLMSPLSAAPTQQLRM